MGKSILVRRGRKSTLAIVSYGSVLTEALKAADVLSSEKIPVDVINARFAAPIDAKLANLLSRGKRLITVEDHFVSGGFGSAVLELAAANGQDAGGIRVLGAPRRLIGHHSRSAQLMEAGINADVIVKTAKAMVTTRRSGSKSA